MSSALIATGCSNHKIAGELNIAEATAVRHVANILDKLGLKSRAQVGTSRFGGGCSGIGLGLLASVTPKRCPTAPADPSPPGANHGTPLRRDGQAEPDSTSRRRNVGRRPAPKS